MVPGGRPFLEYRFWFHRRRAEQMQTMIRRRPNNIIIIPIFSSFCFLFSFLFFLFLCALFSNRSSNSQRERERWLRVSGLGLNGCVWPYLYRHLKETREREREDDRVTISKERERCCWIFNQLCKFLSSKCWFKIYKVYICKFLLLEKVKSAYSLLFSRD